MAAKWFSHLVPPWTFGPGHLCERSAMFASAFNVAIRRCNASAHRTLGEMSGRSLATVVPGTWHAKASYSLHAGTKPADAYANPIDVGIRLPRGAG